MSPHTRVATPARPRDCVFAVGVPLTEAGFKASALDATRVPRYRSLLTAVPMPGQSLWNVYEATIAQPIDSALRRMESVGVQVIREVSRAHWAQLFRDPDCVAVVLLTHFNPEHGLAELGDGYVEMPTLAAGVGDFTGVVELVACHSANEVPKLRPLAAPNGQLRCWSAPMDALFWPHFFAALFETLAQQPTPYPVAFQRLWLAVRKRAAAEVPGGNSGLREP
jgi:hypothetical protein